MMRRLMLNGWNLALVVLLVGGLLAGLESALQSLGPPWAVAGVLPVGIVVVCEALITQRIVVQERYGLADQGQVRLLEWSLILVMVRCWALFTNDIPVLQQMEPWLRDPIAVFNRQFLGYLVLAAIGWWLATRLGREVLIWSAEEPPREQLRADSIDRGHADAEQAEAVSRFDQQLRLVVGITLVLSVIGLRNQPHTLLSLAHGAGEPVLGTLVGLIAAFLLHSAANLRMVRNSWQHDGAVVAHGVVQRWQRSTVLLVLALLLVGPLLGSLALVAPPPPLVPIINLLLVAATFLTGMMLFMVAIVFTPIAWLLSLLRGQSDLSLPVPPRLEPPQLPVDAASGPRPLLPALIFWGALTLLFVVVLLRYLRQRRDIFLFLRRWRAGRWLLALVGTLWQDARGWVREAGAAVRRRRQRPVHTVVRRERPSGAQAQMRALYRRMIRAGTEQGVPHAPGETPFEYGAALGSAVPPAKPDVTALTEAYVLAEYGPTPPNEQDVQRGLQLWRRVRQWVVRQNTSGLGPERRGRPRIRPPKR